MKQCANCNFWLGLEGTYRAECIKHKFYPDFDFVFGDFEARQVSTSNSNGAITQPLRDYNNMRLGFYPVLFKG